MTSRVVRGNLCAHKARGLFGILSCCMQAFELVHGLGTQDSLTEWSKALAPGASPQGRGFKPHSCHCSNGERERGEGGERGGEERGEERGMRERRGRGKGEKREKSEGCPLLPATGARHCCCCCFLVFCFPACVCSCCCGRVPLFEPTRPQGRPSAECTHQLSFDGAAARKNAHNAAEWTGPCHRKSSWQGSGQDKPAEKKDQWTCLTRAGVRDSAPHAIIKSCSPRGWQEKAKPPPVARPAA